MLNGAAGNPVPRVHPLVLPSGIQQLSTARESPHSSGAPLGFFSASAVEHLGAPQLGLQADAGVLGGPSARGSTPVARKVRTDKEARTRPYNKMRCPHGRDHYSCRDCGGAGICEHKRRRSQCRDCGGKSVCPHNRVRSYCKECGGGGLCQHNRVRSKCKDCGGSGICKHGRHKNLCRECGGSGICVHNHQKNKCRKCQKLNMCGHKIARKSCAECKALRDLGPEALAIKVHELLALLDDEELLQAENPGQAGHSDNVQRTEVVESLRMLALAHASAPIQVANAHFDKSGLVNQHKKRKRGGYPMASNRFGASEQYQHLTAHQMAAGYYHMQFMQQMQQGPQQQKPGKAAKMAQRESLEISRMSADRVDAINKLYMQGLKEIKSLLEEGVYSKDEFEVERQKLHKKKEAGLEQQRMDEAALFANGGTALAGGSIGEPHQQAFAMHYYHQQHAANAAKPANGDHKTMSGEEEDGENDEDDDEERDATGDDAGMPPPPPSPPLTDKDGEAGGSAKISGSAATKNAPSEMGSGLGGAVGPMAAYPYYPYGLPMLPMLAHAPKRAMARNKAGAGAVAEGSMDGGKRGPRTTGLGEAAGVEAVEAAVAASGDESVKATAADVDVAKSLGVSQNCVPPPPPA